MKNLLIILSFAFIGCSVTDHSVSIQPKLPAALSFTIPDRSFLTWYRDSACTIDILPPSFRVQCPAGGGMCVYIHNGIGYDYTCTDLPDTLWGIAEYSNSDNDTLFCVGTTCRVLHDTVVYDARDYFSWLADAICNDSAATYTKWGMCLSVGRTEDTVRVWNPLFSETFTGGQSFCLPKMPLPLSPGRQGVYIYSSAYHDTIYCPATLINAYDDYLTRDQILSFTN